MVWKWIHLNTVQQPRELFVQNPSPAVKVKKCRYLAHVVDLIWYDSIRSYTTKVPSASHVRLFLTFALFSPARTVCKLLDRFPRLARIWGCTYPGGEVSSINQPTRVQYFIRRYLSIPLSFSLTLSLSLTLTLSFSLSLFFSFFLSVFLTCTLGTFVFIEFQPVW